MADDTQTVVQPTSQATSQTTVDYSKWYYEFDPTTFKYVRAVHEQTDNTTTEDPAGIYEPVFDKTAGKWTGDTVEAFMEKMKAQSANASDPVQKQISGLTQMIIAQQAELATLKAQQTTTTTATAQPSQTASQTASQSASQSTTQTASQSTSQSTSAVTGGTANV